MAEGTFNQVIEELKGIDVSGGGKAEFLEDHCPIELSKDNFREVIGKKGIKLGFVDGGSADIISAPNFSLQFIRTYYSIFENNKKISSRRFEFYILTKAKRIKEQIFYSAKAFGESDVVPKEKIVLESRDSRFSGSSKRVNISRIGDIARRIAEIKTAEIMSAELDKDDAIILDGNLKCFLEQENLCMNKLQEIVKHKKIILSALAKTSGLMTENGGTLTAEISSISPEGRWYYYPSVNIKNPKHRAEVYFVKLHDRADHVFRFEIFNEQKDIADKIIGEVSSNSNDLSFPGYPYGLIDADIFARVKNSEVKILRTKFKIKLGRDWDKINMLANSINAHSILDRFSNSK